MKKLLTRDDFRESVFERDGYRCVACGENAADAHHIIDRALWSDGEYYLNNGASVCEDCHMKCETTEISVEEIRSLAGIDTVVVPENLDASLRYDKWGNEILSNGMRMKGEMFFKDSVQKLLRQANMLSLFTDYIKYPRTPHLPFSQGATSDDKVLSDLSHFHGHEVIVTEKMDGENTTMYSNYIHARSIDSRNHLSRNLLKSFHAAIARDIPEGFRICGENMFAKHSIHYHELEHHFLGFSIWDSKNMCLSFDETLEWFELIGIISVPVLWRGIFDEKNLRSIADNMNLEEHEGFVVRKADAFSYSEFRLSMAKFVRKSHVQTDEHWSKSEIIPNDFKRSF